MMYKITHTIKLNTLDIALIYTKQHFKVNTEVIIWLQEKFDFGVNTHLTIITPKLFMCQSSFILFFLHCGIYALCCVHYLITWLEKCVSNVS